MKMVYDNPTCGPVILSQPVDRLNLAEVKELKLQLNRILFEVVKREQELVKYPMYLNAEKGA